MPFYTASLAVLERSHELGFDLYVGWHGLATAFYITARKRDEAYASGMMRNLLSWATVSTVGQQAALDLDYGIVDYEDALQAAAAHACHASLLITRDASGFLGSPVPVISPEDFLLRFGSVVNRPVP